MKSRKVELFRETGETTVGLKLDMSSHERGDLLVDGVPFFVHILQSMSFHGGFRLDIKARGDVDVDPHHLVEDIGLVFGDALRTTAADYGPVYRFGHRVIPMDDALSEAAVDVCGRPFLNFNASFPQEYAGEFPLALIREFLAAVTNKAGIALHAFCREGINSHHMVESLFKALGKALGQAYSLLDDEKDVRSTKGVI